MLNLFLVFFRLGWTSFGGPIAHLGYFRTEFVDRRQWLDDKAFADLVALCQFLPGPASSQTGLAIGFFRGGWPGALVAWLGFTVPSALIMILAGYGVTMLENPGELGLIRGLKLVAVVIVADAVWSMAGNLCPDRNRRLLALGAAAILLAINMPIAQITLIILGGVVGLAIFDHQPAKGEHVTLPTPSKWVGLILLAVFAVLLVIAILIGIIGAINDLGALASVFRAGALVFGGGHVVLPLLQAGMVDPGYVTSDDFLAGYGIAQAVPGPLFTFSSFLGTVMEGPLGGVAGGVLALIMIFLPGALLVLGALPFWGAIRNDDRARKALAGVNAAVVGILLAALYDPVFTSSVENPLDAALLVVLFAILKLLPVPVWGVVAAGAIGGSLFL